LQGRARAHAWLLASMSTLYNAILETEKEM
jgi:hypothetical protein